MGLHPPLAAAQYVQLALWAAARSLLKTSTLARFPGATNPHATWTLQFQQSMERGKPSPGSTAGSLLVFLGDNNWIFERKVFEMEINWKKFMMAALIRAIRTFAQTFVSMVAVGAAFSEVEWVRVMSVSGVAFVLSVLTSLATGLPEVEG